MTPTKRFFLIFFAVYLVGAVAIIVLYGPARYSRAYMDQYGDEHQRYLEITKSEAYKLHRERPALHPAEGKLADQVAFVEEYESREVFQQEKRRVFLFNLLFDIYNSVAAVIIVVWFGKKPLLNFLDEKIDDIRHRIKRSEDARALAAKQKAEAEAKLQGLAEEKRQITAQMDEAIQIEKENVAAFTEENLELIAAETEDRKQREARQAAMQMKAEIVERSVNRLSERLRKELTEAHQAALVEEFVNRLEEFAP
jgi:F0F1-type ATP synthase membrane subunit b/b'